MVLQKVFHSQQSSVGRDRVADMDDLARASLELAAMIEKKCPACGDRDTAVSKLRESLFYAREAILLEGHV